MPRFRIAPAVFAIVFAAFAADDAQVRKEIEAKYTSSLQALKAAKSIEDLDADHQRLDTLDWVSIAPGQKPMSWDELRGYGFQNLAAPFDEMSFPIDKLTMKDEKTAIVEGTITVKATREIDGVKHLLVSTAPIRDTWVKTPDGWRRKIHEKLAPNQTTMDGKPLDPPKQ